MNVQVNEGEYHKLSFFNSKIKITIVIAILYIIIAKISAFTFIPNTNIAPFFPAVGFSIAAIIILGRKALFGILLGSFIFSLWLFESNIRNATTFDELLKPLSFCIFRPLIMGLNAVIVSYLTQFWCKTKYPFDKGSNVLYFTLACLIGSFLSTSLGSISLVATPYVSMNNFLEIWGNLLISNTLGAILFTPFVLSWLYKNEEGINWTFSKIIEAIILTVLTVATSIFIFTTHANNESVIFFFLIWAAYRFNLKAITFVTLLVTVISLYFTSRYLDEPTNNHWSYSYLMLQLFLFVNLVSIAFLHGILAEKRNKTNKLSESEEKFRSFFENIIDVYFMSNMEGNLYEVSPSIFDYLGYTRQEMLAINMGDLYADQSARKKVLQELISNGEIKDYEIDLIKKNGQVSSFALTAKLISNKKDNISHFEGSVRCLDEWKENQLLIKEQYQKIKKSEQDFRILFENVQDVFFKTDLKTDIILDVSPSCSYFNGITREELIGQSIYNIYPDIEQLKQMSEIIAVEHEISDYNNEIIIKNKHYYVSINAKLLWDSEGKPEYLVGALRNITERRVAEENLKISEENYRLIFDSIHDVFFKTDLKTQTILDVSPSCRYFNGVTREELIGQRMSSIYNNNAQMLLMFNEIATEQKIIDFNNEIIIKGKIFYVSINATIIYDENGEPDVAVGAIRDITERRLAEENLKLSEEKFRSIYESFEDIYFKRNLDGTIIEVSPSVEKYFDLNRESLIGKDFNAFYYDLADVDKFNQTIIREKEVGDFEERYVNSNGEILFFSVNARLRYNDDGEPSYIEGTMRNINERKKTELEIAVANEKIKESEKKYRTIFESVRDVFFRASVKDQKIIDISPSCSYFNIKQEEVIGSSFADFYYNLEDREHILEELKVAGEIKNYHVQIIVSSNIYTVSINARIIHDENNEPEYMVGSIRDISDKIEAKENLKISEEKFRSIYENFQDVYMKTTIDGILLDVSPSFEKNFQIPRSEVIGTSVFDYYLNKKNKELLLSKLTKEGHISDFDVQLYDPSGDPLYFSINAHLLYDKEGIPINIEGTMRNINERRQMQDEMLTKNRKLEFQNTELEQFAYIASHDLQEPLITVSHCSELLEEELTGKLEEDQQHYLTFIRSSTLRMQLLIKGLLDYSRIGKERATSIIDCNSIVSDVILDMKSSIDESKATIEYEQLPTIEANATEMRQLFQNMISNAIKFRKKDNSPKIKISAVAEEKKWVFSVADNGIGIKKEDLEKVFVIFKRLHNRSEYEGTGIGLSHCKKIIEHHNGRIWVESKYNEGSTFKWTLPFNEK